MAQVLCFYQPFQVVSTLLVLRLHLNSKALSLHINTPPYLFMYRKKQKMAFLGESEVKKGIIFLAFFPELLSSNKPLSNHLFSYVFLESLRDLGCRGCTFLLFKFVCVCVCLQSVWLIASIAFSLRRFILSGSLVYLKNS